MNKDVDFMSEMLDWRNISYKWNKTDNEETIEILGILFTFTESGGLLKVEKLEEKENKK